MHLPEVVSNLQRRTLRPSTWVAALVFGGIWILIRVLSGIQLGDMGIGEFLVPTGLLAGHLILSPVPWQWSGDARQVARPWRGGLQALVWNAAWLGLFLLLLQGTFRPPPPQRDRVGSTEPESKAPESGREQTPSAPGTPTPQPAPIEERGVQEPPKPREARPPRREEADPSRPATEEDRRPPRQEEGNRRPPRRDEERPPRPEDQDRGQPRRHEGQRPPRAGDEKADRPPRPRNGRDSRPARPEEADRPRPNGGREPATLPVMQIQGPKQVAYATQVQRMSSPDPEASGRDRSPRTEQARPPKPKGLLPVLPEHRSELMLLLMNFPFAIVLGWFLAEKERAESTEAELQAKAKEARSKALQAQLHPHALYNTLSGLTELVHEDPDAAEEALVGLTELLRLLTRHAGASELPLAQERTLLRHFLAIEQIRLGARLTVSWNWPDWADTLLLPPLLLQPLVENAVKHGIATAPEGGALKVGIYRAGRDLLLRVANTGTPLAETRGEGTGLRNLRERLALLEPLEASLDLRSEDGWTVAEVRLRQG